MQGLFSLVLFWPFLSNKKIRLLTEAFCWLGEKTFWFLVWGEKIGSEWESHPREPARVQPDGAITLHRFPTPQRGKPGPPHLAQPAGRRLRRPRRPPGPGPRWRPGCTAGARRGRGFGARSARKERGRQREVVRPRQGVARGVPPGRVQSASWKNFSKNLVLCAKKKKESDHGLIYGE